MTTQPMDIKEAEKIDAARRAREATEREAEQRLTEERRRKDQEFRAAKRKQHSAEMVAGVENVVAVLASCSSSLADLNPQHLGVEGVELRAVLAKATDKARRRLELAKDEADRS
jgi:hypothetical protein